MTQQNNPADAAVAAVEAATEAVQEAVHEVVDAGAEAGAVGAAAEAPQQVADAARQLLDAVAGLTAVTQRLEQIAMQPPAMPAQSTSNETGVEETETELPPAQIIPKKPHWFHRLPKIPLVTS